MQTSRAVTRYVLALAVGAMLPLSAAVAAKPGDATITNWVNIALSEDPRVFPSDITVSTDDGIVTLKGTVRNLAEKRYADLEAKKIKGVRGTVNQLNVKTSYRSDADMTQEIRQRIITSPVIQSNGIGVQVVHGNVTLTGVVGSYSEEQQAVLLASEIRGVQLVNNDLSITYATGRSDTDVQKDVQAKLQRDVYLVALPVSAAVKNGVVTLSGDVGNAYQKSRAGEDALWVANVASVQNNLNVVWWEQAGVREHRPMPSDTELAASVREELWQNLRLIEPWDITAKADLGHVTLRGTVPTYYQKWIAGQAAQEVVGVGWVSNMIQVKPAWRDDQAVRADVTFLLKSDYALNGDAIDVRVHDGIVTLSGTVNSAYEKSQAAKDMTNVLGVADVMNNLVVTWQPKYSDAALRERIKERLAINWETAAVDNRITIEVKNSQAILTGDVDSWSQYSEAGRVAFLTDGIAAVDNRLTVKDAVSYRWDDWHRVYPDLYSYYSPYDYGAYSFLR